MKKIVIIGVLACWSHITNAQSAEEVVSVNTDTTVTTVKTTLLEERLSKQEQEIKSLKKDNELLKKKVDQINRSFPNAKRKFTVSRVGSKSVVVE